MPSSSYETRSRQYTCKRTVARYWRTQLSKPVSHSCAEDSALGCAHAVVVVFAPFVSVIKWQRQVLTNCPDLVLIPLYLRHHHHTTTAFSLSMYPTTKPYKMAHSSRQHTNLALCNF